MGQERARVAKFYRKAGPPAPGTRDRAARLEHEVQVLEEGLRREAAERVEDLAAKREALVAVRQPAARGAAVGARLDQFDAGEPRVEREAKRGDGHARPRQLGALACSALADGGMPILGAHRRGRPHRAEAGGAVLAKVASARL